MRRPSDKSLAFLYVAWVMAAGWLTSGGTWFSAACIAPIAAHFGVAWLVDTWRRITGRR